jgi:hypothetical protein
MYKYIMCVHHTCLIHAFYICHTTSSAHGPNPSLEFVGWPCEGVSTAAPAQQSEGWYAGSGTIEGNTLVPRSTIWDSSNHVRALTDTGFKGFSSEKGNEPPGLYRNDLGYPELVVEGMRSITRHLRQILSERDLGPHSK